MFEPAEACFVEETRFNFVNWSQYTVGTYVSWSTYLGSDLWWGDVDDAGKTGIFLKKRDGVIIPFYMAEYSAGYYNGALRDPRSYFLLFSKPDGFKPIYGMVIWND